MLRGIRRTVCRTFRVRYSRRCHHASHCWFRSVWRAEVPVVLRETAMGVSGGGGVAMLRRARARGVGDGCRIAWGCSGVGARPAQ